MDRPPADGPALRYVALGDSYTIGTRCAVADRWPDRLVAALGPDGRRSNSSPTSGVDGYTTGDLIRTSCRRSPVCGPDVVSVLIGVNDVVQGVARDAYRANVAADPRRRARDVPADRVVAVGTPDYTVTPAGADYGDPAAAPGRDRRGQPDHGRAGRASGASPSSTSSTSRRAPRRTARSSPRTASTRRAPSTPCGSSGSRPVVEGSGLRAPSRLAAAVPLELVEPGVADPEVVGDLVVDGVGDPGREGVGRRDTRASAGPRKIVILLGSATWSAPYAVRGTP